MAQTHSTSEGPHALAFPALVAANVLLAFGPWFVRMADTGPVAAGFWRMALAAPLLVAISLGSGWRPTGISRGIWVLIAIAGVSFAADLGTWHLGIVRTTLANATLFGNSTTLIFPLYGFLIARAWPSRTQGFALVIAAIGAALLMGQSYSLNPKNLAGDLLCIFAGVCYTLYFIGMSRARETMAPLPALTLSTLAGIIPLLIFALVLGEKVMPDNWTALIGLALFSQVLGQGLMIYALGQLSPLVVGLGLLMQPVVAAAIGWQVYGERLGATDMVGVVLVAIALVLVRQPAKPAQAQTGSRSESDEQPA